MVPSEEEIETRHRYVQIRDVRPLLTTAGNEEPLPSSVANDLMLFHGEDDDEVLNPTMKSPSGYSNRKRRH